MFLNDAFPECSEEKKANFRAYLEKHGVIDAITEIFNKIILANEKPENPIDFIRQELGDTPVPQETFDNLELEIEEAHREIRRLRKTVEDMGLGKHLKEKESTEKPDGPSSSEKTNN